MADNTTRVNTYDELKEVMAGKRGFILAGWNGDAAVEARIKEETKATIRVIPMETREAACVVTGKTAARSTSPRPTSFRKATEAQRHRGTGKRTPTKWLRNGSHRDHGGHRETDNGEGGHGLECGGLRWLE